MCVDGFHLENHEIQTKKIWKDISLTLIPPLPVTITTAPVPTPTVLKSCDDQETSCVLTCDGNTTDAEPVTYKWRSDNTVSTDSTKEHHITKVSCTQIHSFLMSIFVFFCWQLIDRFTTSAKRSQFETQLVRLLWSVQILYWLYCGKIFAKSSNSRTQWHTGWSTGRCM